MRVVSAREFRSNQTKILTVAQSGQPVMLTSRIGNFKIIPIHDEESLTSRICEGLKEVKMIKEGKLPRKTAQQLLDEL